MQLNLLFAHRTRYRRGEWNWLAAAAVFLQVGAAFATAPIQQVTQPTPYQNFYSVVDLTSGPSTDVGTGTIVGENIINNIGYWCVLTADHNFPNSTGIGLGYFGDGTNAANTTGFTGGSFATTYPIVQVYHGGSSGKKDLALAIVRYGAIDPNFVSVKTLKMWNPSATATDAQLETMVKSQAFSEIGYGDTGTPRYQMNVQTGFDKVNSSGIQRFQNNTIAGGMVNNAHGAYTYTDVNWNPGPVSPGNPNLGTGTSFSGDSGGPYFTTDPTPITVTGLRDVLNTAVPPQMMQVNTDTIFAVHTFGDNNNPQLFSDNLPGGGVLLNAADVQWVENDCASFVPEPSCAALLLAATVAFLSRQRRSIT